jgi:hypothetical protein
VVDTKILRKQLQAELESIQEKLRAIDLVESMSAGSAARIVPRPAGVSRALGPTDTMSDYAKSLLSEEWSSSDDLVIAVRAKYPGTSRQGVMTAYRRWVARDDAEVKGNRKKGYSFRLKAKEKGEAVSTVA